MLTGLDWAGLGRGPFKGQPGAGRVPTGREAREAVVSPWRSAGQESWQVCEWAAWQVQVWATGGTRPHEALGTSGAGRETEETSGRGMSE